MDKSQNSSNKFYNSSLLQLLKNQIDKLESLISNLDKQKKAKVYKNQSLFRLFNTQSDNLYDYILEIQKDYKESIELENQDLQKYSITKLGEKIEALIKLVRVLKIRKAKYIKTSTQSKTNYSESKNQLYLQSLKNRESWLLSTLTKINSKLSEKKQMINNFSLNTDKDSFELTKKEIIKLREKKDKIEKELFSVKEQL